ncbi:MAG TPA: S41 family peptidase [Aggregatilineales bacterium]|nr:S41 family peptidase [Aggregatilineales bacterium]
MKEQSPLKSYVRSLALGSLIGIGLAIIFGAGFIVRDLLNVPSVFSASNPQTEQAEGYPLLDEVQGLLDTRYLREQPDYQTRQYAAIRGMLSSLGDRNTFFIEPPVAQSETQVLSGTYGGVGVLLRRDEVGNFVIYPFPESSALVAGVQDGDILEAVNGKVITLSDAPDAVDQLLRGEVKDNNGVEVVIRRDDEQLTFFIPFAVVNVPSIQWRVLDEDARIGYILIMRFTARTPEELQVALEDLTSYDIQGIVLDLRDNGGGLLQEGIDVAGVFLGDAVIMIEVSRAEEREFYANPLPVSSDLPLVVLVNGRTASAAELVAGAIQDWGRGVLVGQKTFGKGTIQQISGLSDKSSLHITTAEWLTPNRNVIDGVGLNPDISMIPDENGRDVELGEAVRHLQNTVLDN